MKFKLPSIPGNDDEKNIIVRVIYYEYYLKKFWLTFRDPYIEIEYQIFIRRNRIYSLLFISFYHFIFGLHTILANNIYNININQELRNLYYIFGTLWIFTAVLTIILLFKKNLNSIINLSYFYISILLFISCSYTFLIFRAITSIPDIINDTNFNITIDFYKFLSQIITTGNNNLFSIYFINILIQFLLFTFVLDIRNFLIFGSIYTLFVSFLYYFMFTNLSFDFKEIYDIIGWKMGLFFHPLVIEYLKKNNINLEQTCVEITKINNKKEETNRLFKEISRIIPYKNSIFNL